MLPRRPSAGNGIPQVPPGAARPMNQSNPSYNGRGAVLEKASVDPNSTRYAFGPAAPGTGQASLTPKFERDPSKRLVRDASRPAVPPAVPPNMRRANSQNTRYMNMLLALDGIPRAHNLFASFSTWVLLAGFVLLPGTFSSFQLVGDSATNEQEAIILHAISNMPLFVTGFACAGVGVLGMTFLWWRWNRNYVWLCNRIFLPGTLNSLAGIISTLTNVLGVQKGKFVTTSKITLAVTIVAAAICGALLFLYNSVLLKGVRHAHDKEVGRGRAGKHGEGFLEEIKWKAKELEPEPGRI